MALQSVKNSHTGQLVEYNLDAGNYLQPKNGNKSRKWKVSIMLYLLVVLVFIFSIFIIKNNF